MDSHPNRKSPKILIARLSAHGDVIQTLPLLAAIKQADPTVFVGWVVEESAAPLLEGHPLIDRLHISRRKTWVKRLKSPGQWEGVLRELWGFIQALRQEAYSVGLDVQGLFKSALLLSVAGIPRRIGYARSRENAALFYTETLPPHNIRDPKVPAVEKFMEFAQRLGYPPLSLEKDLTAKSFFPLPPLTAAASQCTEETLAGLNPHRPVIAIAPATIWPTKHWQEESWKRLIQELLGQGYNLLLLGSPQDQSLAERLLHGLALSSNLRNLVGKTNWPDLYALFQRVDVFIGLDSAPLHIAQAVGHPLIIGLFGPTAPERTGPLGEQHRTLSTQLSCQPCFERNCPLQTHACMTELTVEAVLTMLEQQVAQALKQRNGQAAL